MMQTVTNIDIDEAKSRLSQLVDRAAGGEEIIIARNGRPVARLVGIRRTGNRKPGRMRGRVRVAVTFDDPLPAALFSGDND
jgi:prevent-host-death family protein